jgi:hypothetical protein
MIVGILLIPVGEPALYNIGPLWCIIAFTISCVVEILYLRRFSRGLAKRWIVAGNAVSNGLLMALPPIAVSLEANHNPLARFAKLDEAWWLGAAAALASLACFLGSFAFRVRAVTRKDERSSEGDSPREASPGAYAPGS